MTRTRGQSTCTVGSMWNGLARWLRVIKARSSELTVEISFLVKLFLSPSDSLHTAFTLSQSQSDLVFQMLHWLFHQIIISSPAKRSWLGDNPILCHFIRLVCTRDTPFTVLPIHQFQQPIIIQYNRSPTDPMFARFVDYNSKCSWKYCLFPVGQSSCRYADLAIKYNN
jgi:hypothetical protein